MVLADKSVSSVGSVSGPVRLSVSVRMSLAHWILRLSPSVFLFYEVPQRALISHVTRVRACGVRLRVSVRMPPARWMLRLS